ncbi:class F sortase [Micromonospora yangpuensis]|uniref:Sortase family protein n=1 Tax=Micromonospora yangpuensis TaxID=683228 RepID=A0A1C6V086_9ACTN|nr:class F sortase [Micromonospora yangpuensis]GGL96779.1 hypothetical protein GCM10012279_12810 [Micromonospora yangpuensis]SCL59725.1 Sortase family protein [Micromonospora yangpuensis]
MTSRPGGSAIRRHRRRSPLLGLVAAGAALGVAVGTGVGVATTDPGGSAAGWQPGCAEHCPPATAGTAPTGPPTRVRVPRIDVDSPLTVLGLDRTGALTPPADFDRAGWYGGGPAPGDPGPAVLAGHLDSRHGPAVFARLGELRPGDRVQVWRGGTPVSFRVTRTVRVAKGEFPTTAVYGPTPVPELRLVTCGGDFDQTTGHYRDNVVVFAVTDDPADPFPPSTAPTRPRSPVDGYSSD